MIVFLIIFFFVYLFKIYSSYWGFFYSDEYKYYYKILTAILIIYGLFNLILDYGIFGGIIRIVNIISNERDETNYLPRLILIIL